MIKYGEDFRSEALNKDYFQALGSTRASVRMLSLAWAGLFVLSIDLTHVYFFIKEQFTVRSLFECPFSFSMSSSISHAGLSNHVIQQDIHL